MDTARKRKAIDYTPLSFTKKEIHYDYAQEMVLRGMEDPNGSDSSDNLYVVHVHAPKDNPGLLYHFTTIIPVKENVLGKELCGLVNDGEESIFLNFTGNKRELRYVSDVFRNTLIPMDETTRIQEVSLFTEKLVDHMHAEYAKIREMSHEDKVKYWISLGTDSIRCRSVLYIMEHDNQGCFPNLQSRWGSYYHKKQKRERSIAIRDLL
jgi:hypothetical protein